MTEVFLIVGALLVVRLIFEALTAIEQLLMPWQNRRTVTKRWKYS